MRNRYTIRRAIRDGQIRQDAAEEGAVNVRDLGAEPGTGSDDTVAVQEALTEVLTNGGKLFLPKGTWNITTPLVINKRIEIAGVSSADSILKYSGTGAAIRIEYDLASDGEGTHLHDFQLRGTNAVGQSGIIGGTNDNGILRHTIERMHIDSFSGGYGIYLKFAIGCEILQNRVGVSQEAITLECPAGSAIVRNWTQYWADYGIHVFSIDSSLAPRNNKIEQNLVHGNGFVAQLVPKARAAILVERMGDTAIHNNYIEIILSATGIANSGHGIVLDGTLGITQANSIVGNYFGPGTTGYCISLNSLVSHTLIQNNHLSDYELQDNGLATQFVFQLLDGIENLVGTSTTRMGWINLGTSAPTKLHST